MCNSHNAQSDKDSAASCVSAEHKVETINFVCAVLCICHWLDVVLRRRLYKQTSTEVSNSIAIVPQSIIIDADKQ